MADNWYYVQKGNRQGPVPFEVIEQMIINQELKAEDFVWKKGFENWKKIKEVGELTPKKEEVGFQVPLAPVAPPVPLKKINLKDFEPDQNVIWIRVGTDRGSAPTEYGPYSVNLLKRLFKEKRINPKTEVFIKGSEDYFYLADLPEYEEIFEEVPPRISETEKRVTVRKPFIARLFIQNNKNVFEGVCRDISIGGMQVLMDKFDGKAGDKISINVHPQNTEYHFTASGIIVRLLEGKSGFSFRFIGLSEEAKRAIEKYLQEN